MDDLLRFTLTSFTTLLFIVNPASVIPTFLAITADAPQRRRTTALQACIAGAAILIAFAVLGQLIFRVFGITLTAFRIAGGFVLWVVAMGMLQGERRTQEGPHEISEGVAKHDVAITPLAMPMLTGPGAISTIMVLVGQAHGVPERLAIYAAALAAMLVSYVVMRIGQRIVTRLGETGIRVMTRIMGLLLAAMAVEFVITGATEALRAALRLT